MANGRFFCCCPYTYLRICQALFIVSIIFSIIIFVLKRQSSEKSLGRKFPVVSSREKEANAAKKSEEEKMNMPFGGYKIVHLDLKGAPPRISYFSWFFPFIRKLGANGVLIEYEDMFPYESVDVSARNSYSKSDITEMLKMANESSLEIIPLIQTFGHLEFVLKLEKYMDLREVKRYPQAICPSKSQSSTILKWMIDDIMELHKKYIRYIHIGCDEVYQIAQCGDCKDRLFKNKWTDVDLFLDHVTTVAKYIRSLYPGVTPLIWDDQMRSIPASNLNDWKIGDLVEPVIWKYTNNLKVDLPESLWEKYGQVFPNVWFASAFKGAQSPDTMITPVNYYFENHKAWKNMIYLYSPLVNFKGGILTGWQRFDHFSVLCELLPVAIPSLSINLIYLSSNLKSLSDLSIVTEKTIGCSIFAPMEYGGKECSFPGSRLYQDIFRLSHIVFRIGLAKNQSTFKGWMTDFNFKHSFSNPSYVEDGSREFLSLYMEIVEIQANIETSMETVYMNDTIQEWLSVNINAFKNELKEIAEGRDKILSAEHWPKRPLV